MLGLMVSPESWSCFASIGVTGDAGTESWICLANSNSWGEGKEEVQAWIETGVSGSWWLGLAKFVATSDFALEQGVVCLIGCRDIDMWPQREKR